MPRLIHLNGPPGVGKSTLARRYVEDHPGTLNCDIDVLRTFIGGWDRDFALAGNLIRPAALALIEAYLASGQDVVLPQMLIDPDELSRFETSATNVGAEFVERFLVDDSGSPAERFSRRGSTSPGDPWNDHVRAVVADQGGAEALSRWSAELAALLATRSHAQAIPSVEGEVDGTYALLVASLDH